MTNSLRSANPWDKCGLEFPAVTSQRSSEVKICQQIRPFKYKFVFMEVLHIFSYSSVANCRSHSRTVKFPGSIRYTQICFEKKKKGCNYFMGSPGTINRDICLIVSPTESFSPSHNKVTGQLAFHP